LEMQFSMCSASPARHPTSGK